MAAEWIKGLAVEGPFPPRRAVLYRYVLTLAILVSASIAILDTVPELWGEFLVPSRQAVDAALLVLAADYALRLWLAWQQRPDDEPGWLAVWRYASSAYGVFDFLAVVPFVLGEAFGMSRDGETVFGILRFLKLARYSPALETLGAVILAELRPLMSALFIMVLLIVSTSTLLYFVERTVNPGFSSVPQAMWYSVVTLATLGYGDVVPITVLGKVFGGGVAILGLCMFALPASILASGFTEEMRRQNFVSTWHLVARVPFFTRLQAAQIAEITSLLKVYRAVRSEVLMREGDVGETMYFIVSGQVEVKGRGGTFVLKSGDFFGEIALIERCPRTATVRAMTRCQLLILDVHDFQKFVAGYPHMLEDIQMTAQARMATNSKMDVA
ncbi:MAG: cyclic nucleotide-binding domain-containing protein [Rhodospirillaceae bacterium]|nr:cyclic nucleotide-binding domain-containing protein [Rhodospirillales bacterium]